MKSILIFGGTRFIGKHLLMQFDFRKYKIYYFHRGITNLTISTTAFEIIGDRTNEDDIRRLFKYKFDIIIDISGEDFNMVRLSAKYSKESKPYYIFVSSSSVYQHSESAHSEIEKTKISDVSRYISAKIKSEQLIQGLFEKYAIVRTSKVYGPYNHINREKYYYDKILKKERIVLSKDPVLHFTFVLDLVEGIFCLIQRHPIGIFNIAGAEAVKLSDFVETIGKEMGINPTICWDNKSNAPMTHLHSCVLNNTKMYNTCGWQPQYSIDEGIDFTLHYLKGL